MSKLDVYLRSIEKFGATGAILTSNQAVTLRFPTGDRHATQVTPHDLLVGLVREVASPQVLELVDRQRPARFEYDSQGTRYTVGVVPRAGAWQVTIDAAEAAVAERPAPVAAAPTRAAPVPTGELLIERGQYDAPVDTARPTASGSAFLDELTHAARAARATDLYLGAGAQPIQRGSELSAVGTILAGDQLSREVGVVAPPQARAAWAEGGTAVFAYGDGKGRVRATLARDQRGPTATLRLLPDEVALERLGLDVGDWLERTGLVVIAGPSAAGKTVTLAALTRALGAAKRRVVAIEQPIELVQAGPWVSQREVGTHVASTGEGVAAAMRENADAIVIGCIDSADAAAAAIDAACGGHLVLVTILAPFGGLAIERLVGLLSEDRRELARAVLQATLLGTVCPIPSRTGRTFEVTRPGERRA